MKIKIDFTDFWRGFDKKNNSIYNFLNQYYEVEITDDPDYLFYSCFGFDFVNYNCIRIFYTGENVRPDFNLCDYAIGFDYLTFSDRYIRWPLFMTLEYRTDFENAKNKHITYADKIPAQYKFCNFVYSNKLANSNRDDFFRALCDYKKVDSAGGHLNNMGSRVDNKFEFQKQYKFSIAYENSSAPGYTTEKIVQALAAGTIPIYWGDPLIERQINSECFINAHNYESIDELVKTVIEIDNNADVYRKMIKTPAFKDEFINENDDIKLKNWFDYIFSMDVKSAKRRGNYIWEKRVDNRLLILNRMLKCKMLRKALKIEFTDLY